MVEVQAAWPIGGDSRFVFRKNFAKYELFKSSPVSLCVCVRVRWRVGASGQRGTPIASLDPQSLLTPDSFLPQHSLFPEKMVSSCLDAHADISHDDLIQVRDPPTESWFPGTPIASRRLSLVRPSRVVEKTQHSPK